MLGFTLWLLAFIGFVAANIIVAAKIISTVIDHDK